MDELERELKQKLYEVDKDWQREIEEQHKKTFNKPNETSRSFAVDAVIVAVILGAIGAISAGGIGWAIGLLIGTAIIYIYRATRASTAAQEYAAQTKNNMKQLMHKIEENISNRKSKINEDIVLLEHQYSLPLIESIKRSKKVDNAQLEVTAHEEISYNYAGLVVALVILMVMPFFFNFDGKQSYRPTPTTAFKETDLNTMEEAEAAPTVVHDTFPFEGGLLGKWTAKEELAAYQSEGNTSVIAFTVSPYEEFTAIISNVHVDKVGIAKANENIFPEVGNDSPNKEFFSKRGLKKGDIIGVICYAGEGFCYVWVKGKVGCIDMFWLADDDPKLKKGEWIRKLGKWTLWVKIKNRREEIGWLMIREDGDLEKIKGWSRYD